MSGEMSQVLCLKVMKHFLEAHLRSWSCLSLGKRGLDTPVAKYKALVEISCPGLTYECIWASAKW